MLGVLAAFLPGSSAGAQTVETPTLAVNDVSLSEGNSGTKAATFTVTRSGDTAGTSYVSWATANGTASAPGDYLAQAVTPLTFGPSVTTQQVRVTVKGDTAVEADETFSVNLSAPSGATISDDTGTGTIRNDDTSLVVNNVSVTEGNSGTKTAAFKVTRKGVTTATSSFTWETADATATAPSDYLAQAPTTATLVPGQTTQTLSVTVNGDTVPEPNETFSVKLSSPSGAVIADGTGVGTIKNDDAGLSIDDVSVREGNSGTTPATFTLTRTGITATACSATVATADGSATASSDYASLPSTTVSFAAGQTTQKVPIAINGDWDLEGDETFTLKVLSSTCGVVLDGIGLGTILNDDAELRIDDVRIREGSSGTTAAIFTITRAGDTSGTASVNWSTGNGTATAPGDYAAQPPTTVTFGPTQTTQKLPVNVNGDLAVEGDETFWVYLDSPSNATLPDVKGEGTIVNDDVYSTVAVNDVSVTEGNAGTTTATFSITRSGNTSEASVVTWATQNGLATANTDYIGQAPTEVTFDPGVNTRPASVTVKGDFVMEGNETFVVKLVSASKATITDDTGVGTIVDDDAPVSLRAHNFPNHYVRHRNFLGELTELRTPLDVADGTFKLVPGLTDPSAVSFESTNYPGWYLAWSNGDGGFRLFQLNRNSTTPAPYGATFEPVPGLADPSKVSFKVDDGSMTWYLKHFDFLLQLANGGLAADATFEVVTPPAPTAPVLVPNVVQHRADEAEKALADLGLRVTRVLQEDCASTGMVLDQNPQGGEYVARGSEVQITVGFLREGHDIC